MGPVRCGRHPCASRRSRARRSRLRTAARPRAMARAPAHRHLRATTSRRRSRRQPIGTDLRAGTRFDAVERAGGPGRTDGGADRHGDTMTKPTTYVIRMAVFLLLVAVAVGILSPVLWDIFWHNPGLNGLILLV